MSTGRILATDCVGGAERPDAFVWTARRSCMRVREHSGVAALVVHRFDGSADLELAAPTTLSRPGRGWRWRLVLHRRWRGCHLRGRRRQPVAPVAHRRARNPVDRGRPRADRREPLRKPGWRIGRLCAGHRDRPPVGARQQTVAPHRRLHDDFCPTRGIEADGTAVRWMAWDAPDMPWDASVVQRIGARGEVADVLRTGTCVQQPRTLPDGRSIAVRDDNGWLNVWVNEQPLVAEQFEHAGPSWGPGQRS